MELTQEQYAIINSTGDIKINAVAGSGKTTTIIEYAKARPRESKILYLAFNRSVKLEAAKKFAERRLSNVKVETAHSLAYRNIVFRHNYKVRPQGYKTNEIAELLNLQGNEEKHTEYIVANHINKFIAYFCNSSKQKVQELNYLDIISDPKARTFVTGFYAYIESQSRLLLSKMDKGEIEITHDFYLKKFQLSNPLLNFDYILFDEGQDASPAMLDIFLKQKATKVIVGDTHQQIYGWRFAVNSLEKADFPIFHLSASFRFSQHIANLAMEVLKWKEHLYEYKPVSITGKGNSSECKTKAVLARTNLGLLLKAIEYVTEKKKARLNDTSGQVKHIYFEGNISSYTYADEGASLYDVLNLYNGKYDLIRDKLIRAMKDMTELEDYIEKTEDVQLGMMVEIVWKYGNRIPEIIKTIKDKHVGNDQKEKAEMIFSTVHRCKGMEYDATQLVEDFVTAEKIEKIKEDNKNKKEEINLSKLNEEINLLYVAVTRSRNIIHIPEALVPIGFPPSPQIHVIRALAEDEKKKAETSRGQIFSLQKMDKKEAAKEKTYSVGEVRKKYTVAYKPWTAELDDELTIMYCEGVNVKEIAVHFGRSPGAINLRIKKLELAEIYG
ncbi:MAG: UvrD-helicase domain-containing protein [Ferruginibacter sp.]